MTSPREYPANQLCFVSIQPAKTPAKQAFKRMILCHHPDHPANILETPLVSHVPSHLVSDITLILQKLEPFFRNRVDPFAFLLGGTYISHFLQHLERRVINPGAGLLATVGLFL